MSTAKGLQGWAKVGMGQGSGREDTTHMLRKGSWQGRVFYFPTDLFLTPEHNTLLREPVCPCQMVQELKEASSHLDVIVGVPVRIEDDDSVSSGQIDAQAPSSGGQEEAELLGPRS